MNEAASSRVLRYESKIVSEAGRRVNVTRPLTHSLDLGEEGLAMQATRICSIDGCQRPHRARGLCDRHYAAKRRAGALNQFPRTPPVGECSVGDCRARGNCRGLCWKHRQRVITHGDPHVVRVGRYVGDAANYTTWHKRLAAHLGPARDRRCVDCGGRAWHWSYRGGSPDEVIDADTGLAYAIDFDMYEPRCVQCHAAHDRGSGYR